jgi:hypothetical protein
VEPILVNARLADADAHSGSHAVVKIAGKSGIAMPPRLGECPPPVQPGDIAVIARTAP